MSTMTNWPFCHFEPNLGLCLRPSGGRLFWDRVSFGEEVEEILQWFFLLQGEDPHQHVLGSHPQHTPSNKSKWSSCSVFCLLIPATETICLRFKWNLLVVVFWQHILAPLILFDNKAWLNFLEHTDSTDIVILFSVQKAIRQIQGLIIQEDLYCSSGCFGSMLDIRSRRLTWTAHSLKIALFIW